jgi:2-oxoglutarate dehydrogenase complex dehydrogenase (E1) component-like enzyme
MVKNEKNVTIDEYFLLTSVTIFQMHLRFIQRQLTLIQISLKRTYKYQTKVFGYNTQLKTIGNTEEIEKILCKYIRLIMKFYFSINIYVGDYNRARQANPHAALLIDAYRKHGHRLAKIDPLGILVNT